MTTTLRTVLALLLAAWLAVPSTSSEGGENAGGTGVWILPCAAQVTQEMLQASYTPRSVFECSDLQQGARLKLETGLGIAVATIVDDVSGTPVALSVNGSVVACPGNLLQAFASAGATSATLMIANSSQRGYVISVTIDASANKAVFAVK